MMNPNLRAAAKLLERSTYVMERHKAGRPMTRRQAKKYMGCAPEDVLDRLADLTAHITILDDMGRVVSAAYTPH